MPETTKQSSLLELKTWEGGSGKEKWKKEIKEKEKGLRWKIERAV